MNKSCPDFSGWLFLFKVTKLWKHKEKIELIHDMVTFPYQTNIGSVFHVAIMN